MKLNLPVHSYRHTSTPIGSSRLLNCYAEVQPPEGKSPTGIIRAEGIIASADFNDRGRGLYRFQQRLYAVVGSQLYSLDADGTSHVIGLIQGSSVCTFADNGLQMVICDPVTSYIYDGALGQITDPDFNRGIQCGVIDSYILFISPEGQFFGSNLAQASSYDALDFATPEGAPDKTIGLIADHRQAALLGTDSLELWEDVGGTGFAFGRSSNGFVELGGAAGYSLAKADNSFYWLASDLTVRRLDGATPVKVSQPGVEQAIAEYAKTSTVSDARGFGYTLNGHIFYVLTFPTAGHTWVLDATTREWHERESYGLTRWRPCATAFCYGRNYVQDYQTGRVGWLDATTHSEWGGIQRMSWTYPGIYNKGKLLTHSRLAVRVDTGTGNGAGSEPFIQLEISDDDGHKFVTVENQSLGKQGHYKKTVEWTQLGQSDARVYRNTISDDCQANVSDAQLDVH